MIVENYNPGEGKILIECYGDSWSAFWGGMGSKSLEEFFISCDTSYLSKKLCSDLPSTVVDEGKLKPQAQEYVTKNEYHQFEEVEIQALREDIEYHLDISNHDLLYRIYGEEWWRELPEKTNPKYEYLRRVIETVQAAFKATSKDFGVAQ